MNDSNSMEDRLVVSDILVNRHRNHVLRVLQTHGTPMALTTLSMHIDEPGGDAFESVVPDGGCSKTQLHHQHLPKLDDTGVITYDPSSRLVLSLDDERLDYLLERGEEMLESLRRSRTGAK
ncbi:hypothetical protein ACFQJC_01680 [Haloferax namakaokahaiae]|uniref:DUF7344 domain-containing protein n=1 Tax=Haloferax namakaokahaiae TaxID=1748331 RepID=A0ABD5ZB04_9EURY